MSGLILSIGSRGDIVVNYACQRASSFTAVDLLLPRFHVFQVENIKHEQLMAESMCPIPEMLGIGKDHIMSAVIMEVTIVIVQTLKWKNRSFNLLLVSSKLWEFRAFAL